MSISIGPTLHPARFISELKHRRRESVLGELSRHARVLGIGREPELLHATLLLRERLGSTSAGHGIALPNARSLLVPEPLVLVGRSRRGIAWSATDREPVHLVLLVLSPPETPPAAHVEFVARTLAVARPARVRNRLLESDRPEEIAGILRELTP
jgi:mannitol/fructose-specific phosphotransferase system IIA component (Ntr-type)